MNDMPHDAGKQRCLIWVVVGFVLLWLIMDRLAAALESTRGEAGLLIAAIVLGAAIAVEIVISRCGFREAVRRLGFVWPNARGIWIAGAVTVVLLAYYPVFAWITETEISVRLNWLWMVPGLFAQGGLAEETIFRGFLFRQLRARRQFWPAALVSMVCFTAVHLLLFFHLPPQLALASILLAATISFPLAALFELSGNSVITPALLHFIIQGTIKMVEIPELVSTVAAIGWMGLAALVPWIVFAFFRPSMRASTCRAGASPATI